MVGAPVDYHGQRVVEALKLLTTALPALTIALGLRCYLTVSCLRMIHLSMLTEDCCGIMFMASWWVVCLSSHAMISVILRIMFTAKLTGFLTTVSSDRIAMLKKCDIALVLFGTVWNGLGLLCVFAWPSNEAAALRHAVVLYGFSTFIAYPVEVYIFYWRVIAFHENVAHISDLFTLPRNAWNDEPQKKRGSLKCCSIVDFDELTGVERTRASVCSICLDEVDPSGSVRKTPCGHFFHDSCLEGWFRQGALCPVCRTDCSLPDVDDMSTPDV